MRKSIEETDPWLLGEWDYEKNDIDPKQVTRGSHKKRWWICREGHSFNSTPGHRTSMTSNCPYCSGRKVLVGYNDVATTHSHLVSEWDASNTIKLTEVTSGSNKKMKWVCKKGHTWLGFVYHRALNKSKCPICTNRITVRGYNSLEDTHPALLQEWDYEKNTIKPWEVQAGSKRKIWWKCAEGHSYGSWVANKSESVDFLCPGCVRIRDPWIVREISSWFEGSTVNYKLDDIKWDNGVRFEVDLILPSGWIIEFDGNTYHKEQISISRDVRKSVTLVDQGYKVIRIRQKPLDFLDLELKGFHQISFKYRNTKSNLNNLRENIERILNDTITT